VRFEVFMAVTIMMIFWFRHHVDQLVKASISYKFADSIFRAEVISWDSEGLYSMAGWGSLTEMAILDGVRQRRAGPMR
jgi:hypothetical protein